MSDLAPVLRTRSSVAASFIAHDVMDRCAEHVRRLHRARDVADVIRRWNAGRGDDTAAISAATGIPQADVCRIVAADQDRRHAARTASRHLP